MHTGDRFYVYQNSSLQSVWTPINITAEVIKRYYSAYFISCIFNEVWHLQPTAYERRRNSKNTITSVSTYQKYWWIYMYRYSNILTQLITWNLQGGNEIKQNTFRVTNQRTCQCISYTDSPVSLSTLCLVLQCCYWRMNSDLQCLSDQLYSLA